MDIDGFLASPWIKHATIAIGILSMICAIYDIATVSSIGGYSLSCLGCSITILAILLYLYHHDESFKNVVSSLSSSDSS
jgi:hypothetical protein